MDMQRLINLQLFAEGGAPGTGTPGGTGTSDQGGQGAGAAGGDAGAGNGTDNAGGKATVAMTQGELDALIEARLKRQEKNLREQLKHEQDEAKKAADMTDMDKAKAAHQKAEAERDAAKAEAKRARIEAALLLEAAKAGAHDPDDVVRLADLAAVDMDDNNRVTGAAEAVKKLQTAKSHLFRAAGAGGGQPGANFRGDNGTPSPAEQGRKMAEERNKGKQAPTGGYNPWAPKGV